MISAGYASVVKNDRPGAIVEVQDLTIRQGEPCIDGGEAASLTVTSVLLDGCYSYRDFGAAIRLSGGQVIVEDSTILNPYANCYSSTYCGIGGAGVFVEDGDAALVRTTIEGAVASARTHDDSGGAFGASVYVDGNLTMTDSIVTDSLVEVQAGAHSGCCTAYAGGGGVNVGGDLDMIDSWITSSGMDLSSTTGVTDGYGGAAVVGGSVTCTASTVGLGGLTGNSATEGGGALWWNGTGGETIRSEGCDWGEAAQDNAPDDIQGKAGGDFGADAWFTCTSAGCVEDP